MMLFFFRKLIHKNSKLFLFALLVFSSFLLLIESKYTFNKFHAEIQGTTNSETIIKNFAMNLADTKLLKITNFLKEGVRKKFKNKNRFEANDEFYSDSNFQNRDDALTGSVLISLNGEMNFSKDFISESDTTTSNGNKLIARARYTKSLGEIGWSKLYVETFDNTSPEIQSWAAGFLEGKLCAEQILDFYKNLVGIHSKETSYLKEVFEYYKKVEESIRYRTSKPVLANLNVGKELEYWISVAMIQAQTDGLLAGYNTIMKEQPLNFAQIYFINADGEVPELLSVFKYKEEFQNRFGRTSQYSFKENTSKKFFNKKEKKFSKEYLQHYFGSTDPDFIWNKLMSESHCSGVIKLIRGDDGLVNDVLIGHTTWDSYSEMHRIYKIYNFSYTMYGTEKKRSKISFSSYPGTLTSTDDFYLLNNQIVVLETTLEILDRTLYTKTPKAEEHVPNYIRISVANRLATTGQEWTEIFKLNNGGTYNSQWMIIDYSKLKQVSTKVKNQNFSNEKDNIENPNDLNTRADLKDNSLLSFYRRLSFSFKQDYQNQNYGLFTVLEQIPGYIKIKDMTDHLLEHGFWASYNRPYFDKVFRDAGYYEMMQSYGRNYSYDDNPRAKLILANINNISNIEGLKMLMQYNKNIMNNDYINTVSPRFDLSVKSEFRKPSGGIDSKIVSQSLVQQGTVVAISGPSTQGGITPFDWDDWPGEPHYGLPSYWNFGWVNFNENYLKNE